MLRELTWMWMSIRPELSFAEAYGYAAEQMDEIENGED